jgi:Ni/Co efflux regulator RcnB
MKRLILAIALLSSFAIPVAASVRNGVAEVRQHSEMPVTAHTSTLRRTPARVHNNPYWQPCDYSSDYGENGCGD